ncbi:hypothetical protein SAMN05720761_1393 [Fibrobacter sp. UWCM]|uniref:hypothetical protein n=1 Tax=Fibrobacter sp. UWCM TaxID=1896208 RepID=UPI0009128765|nr:hypothetical protein [Fibrobacter sp. UWCM]SHH89980.1 hypothetical protein SAMN05720761_1393 [Fibrobacter sp. UWCM]
MIITLNMDTEKDKEVCKKVLSLILDFGGTVDLEVVGQPRPVKRLYKDVKGIWPTEEAEFKKPVNNEQPKKRRGRPPKAKNVYSIAREKLAERVAK